MGLVVNVCYKIKRFLQFLGSCVTPSPAQPDSAAVLPSAAAFCFTGRILLMASQPHSHSVVRSRDSPFCPPRWLKPHVHCCRSLVADQGGDSPNLHIWSADGKPTIWEPETLQGNLHWFWELCSKESSKCRSRQQRMMPILPPDFFPNLLKNKQKQNHMDSPVWSPLSVPSQDGNFSGDRRTWARKFND